MPARILELLRSGDAIIIHDGGSAPLRSPAHDRPGAGRRASGEARKMLRELIALRKEGKRN